MSEGINVFSGFDGMSCGQVVLNSLGVPIKNYFASEIKQHAIKVTNYHFPDTHQMGDITKISACDLPVIDLFIGGSPCQDFSRANSERLGLDGNKSGLFYEYVRLLSEVKAINPSVLFFLENVKMKTEHEDIITEVLGVPPVKINSKLLSPQLRDRLYWTNISTDIPQPKDTMENLQEVLETGYTERLKSRALLESDSRPLSTPVKMFHRHMKGFNTLIFKNKEHYLDCKDHYLSNFPSKTAKEVDSKLGKGLDVSVYNGVRYFTKTEREVLQGLPRDYCECLTRDEAACLLGDGWNCQTIKYIFGYLPDQWKTC